MNLAIFGASGATGRLLTDLALHAGHHVSALVRNPDEFPFRDRVRLVKDAGFKTARIRDTIGHADAVLSTLGPRTLRNEQVVERALPIILKGMRQAGVGRIVVLGGASAHPESLRNQPAPVRWFMLHVVYKNVLQWPSAAHRFQWETLSASGLEWTMVLPPMLTNGRPRGRYRTDTVALPPRGFRISRADVAAFMLHEVTSSDHPQQNVYIAW